MPWSILYPTYFVGLTAVGFRWLWLELINNGTASLIAQVKTSNVFSDGTNLRHSFTGWQIVDNHMTSPVIFYADILSSRKPSHRLLLTALFTTMQAASNCMQLETLASGWPPWARILESVAWGSVNQAWGAAVVYPLWCVRQMTAPTVLPDAIGQMDTYSAEAFLVSTLFNMLSPLLFLSPTYMPPEPATIQLIIAYYRFMPLLSGLSQPIFKIVLRGFRARTTDRTSKTLIRRALWLSTAYAAFSHISVLLCATMSPHCALWDIFWPEIQPYSVAKATSIAQGAQSFLAYDWWLIACALIPLSSSITTITTANRLTGRRRRSLCGGGTYAAGFEALADLIKCICAGLLLSPGAVLSGAYALSLH